MGSWPRDAVGLSQRPPTYGLVRVPPGRVRCGGESCGLGHARVGVFVVPDARGTLAPRYCRRVGLMTTCGHLDQIRDVTPEANGCVDCLAAGDTWVHLRLCMTCRVPNEQPRHTESAVLPGTIAIRLVNENARNCSTSKRSVVQSHYAPPDRGIPWSQGVLERGPPPAAVAQGWQRTLPVS